MNVPPISDTSGELPGTHDDLFSTDPELRAIELSFLNRLISAMEFVKAEVLKKEGSSHENSAVASLAEMQSLPSQSIAQELQTDVSAGSRSGQFPENQDKEGPT